MQNISPDRSDGLTPPYGGILKEPALLSKEEAKDTLHRASRDKWHRLRLSARELGDTEMLRMGAFSPLTGFMKRDDWFGVCRDMQMTNKLFWPLPITLSADPETATVLRSGTRVLLCDEDGTPVAVLSVADVYRPDKKWEAEQVFGTQDPKHPGVAVLYAQGDYYVGGDIEVLNKGRVARRFSKYCLTPHAMRRRFAELGWKEVTAFQTRNPLHRAHEFLTKIALESGDGVLIHSILGELKQDDIPAEVRMRAIEVLIKNYYIKDSVVNAGYPMGMRYAGPREALLHALFRQNYGCSRIIIGRDHAGVGDYYDPFAAQRIFTQIPPDTLRIKPLNMDWTFWCYACEGMASARSCPHSDKEKLLLSGTKLRERLSAGTDVPPQFSRPEVLDILRSYYSGCKKA